METNPEIQDEILSEVQSETRFANRARQRKKKMRRGLKALLIILGIMVLLIIAFIIFMIGGKDSTMNQQIGDVNLGVIDDGVYTGSYSALRWSNTVEVTVEDHQITDIKVIKPQVAAKEETIETLTQEVLAAQNLQVDAVSEATVDSKAFLKAVENALMNALGS